MYFQMYFVYIHIKSVFNIIYSGAFRTKIWINIPGLMFPNAHSMKVLD